MRGEAGQAPGHSQASSVDRVVRLAAPPINSIHLARNSRFQLEIDGSGEYPCVAVRAGALTEADCTDPCGVFSSFCATKFVFSLCYLVRHWKERVLHWVRFLLLNLLKENGITL